MLNAVSAPEDQAVEDGVRESSVADELALHDGEGHAREENKSFGVLKDLSVSIFLSLSRLSLQKCVLCKGHRLVTLPPHN